MTWGAWAGHVHVQPMATLAPWEKRIKKEDLAAARELFQQTNAWTSHDYQMHKSRVDAARAADNVDRLLSIMPGLQERRAQGLKEWDDKIAAAREKIDGMPFQDALHQELVAPLEKQKAEWAAANPAGLNAAERRALQEKLSKPSTWGEAGQFEVGRFRFDMSVIEAVPKGGDGGSMTSSTETRSNGSDTAGASHTKDDKSDFSIGGKATAGGHEGAPGGEASIGYSRSSSESHTESRSRTDDSGRTSGAQAASGAQIQDVTLRAQVTDIASGSRTEATIDRVTVKTSK